MFNCCFTSSPEINPFQNVLLDIDHEMKNLRRESAFYEIAYVVSCIAVWALAIGAIFYLAAVGSPVWGIILAGGIALVSINFIFEYLLYSLGDMATNTTNQYLFEKDISELSKTLIREGRKSDREEFYYQEKIKKMGLTDPSTDLKRHIQTCYKEPKSSPLRYLAPLIARAEAYHRIAQERLDEIALTFYSVPKDSKSNPYQAEIERLNSIKDQPAHVIPAVRQKVRTFEAIHTIKWKEYFENRFKEIFVAHILENPVHSGKMTDVGYLAEDVSLIDYLLEHRRKERGTLFAFNPHFLEITRESFEEKHKEAYRRAIAAGLLHLIENNTGPFLAPDEATISRLKEEASSIPGASIGAVIDAFASNYAWSPSVSFQTFQLFLDRHFEELFCKKEIQEAIRPLVNAHYVGILNKYDLSSLRSKLGIELLKKCDISVNGLPSFPTRLDLKADFFSTEIVMECKRLFGEMENHTICNFFERTEFHGLLDTLEVNYYALKITASKTTP